MFNAFAHNAYNSDQAEHEDDRSNMNKGSPALIDK
jgi:hypothetical protein